MGTILLRLEPLHEPSSTRMLRILHVISGDLWAGAEVMAHNLLSELASDPGIEVRAVLLNEGKLSSSLREHGVATEVIDETQLGSLSVLRRLYALTRNFRPTIVHTHRQKENVLGAIVAKLVGARSLRTVHGWNEFPKLGYRIDKRIYRALDLASGRWLQERVIAVSSELRAKLATQFADSQLIIIENGIDVDSVRSAASQPVDFETDKTKKSVGIIARLVPVKRHDRFIEAAEILLAEHPESYEFHIIGDGPLYAEVAARIQESTFSSCIRLHGFQENVPAVLSLLDCTVICSDHEGLPMNALEAAVVGVPIVTTPLPTIQELFEQGVRGVVCADASPRSIARGMHDGLALSKQEARGVDSSWAFSNRTMAEKYRQVYGTLAAGNDG